jgi:hypothetical protein
MATGRECFVLGEEQISFPYFPKACVFSVIIYFVRYTFEVREFVFGSAVMKVDFVNLF